ncbi:hypothetical protein CDL12_20406 [Handroanthus impetiginosus]|uniref:Uncharacterized protein n=1 Tax=Handroanthus impetiginosus TaxID=429701 RepID=A0A2G9GPV1_9LAMI|nr:hypothetical protein CDL12_20406 [Handroanthus impetiginosus]
MYIYKPQPILSSLSTKSFPPQNTNLLHSPSPSVLYKPPYVLAKCTKSKLRCFHKLMAKNSISKSLIKLGQIPEFCFLSVSLPSS